MNHKIFKIYKSLDIIYHSNDDNWIFYNKNFERYIWFLKFLSKNIIKIREKSEKKKIIKS